MKRSLFMISDYPHLVKYFASRNPIHLFIYVCPLWIYLGQKMANLSGNLFILLLGILFGVLYWTLIEYSIHRFLYHQKFKNPLVRYFVGSFHLYHHNNMSDHRVLNSGFLMLYCGTPLVIAPIFLLLGDTLLMNAIILGLTIGYYLYECVHYLIHYKKYSSGYFKFIQDYHMFHHDHAPLKNFGNTSQLWDVVLGTYDARYKNYSMSEKTESTLITSSSLEENLMPALQSQN